MKYRAICENHLYAKAYSKGKKAITKTLAVYVLPDYRAEVLKKANPMKKKINRVGLTVSKKIGHAVVRNRTKRIIREAYRHIDKTHTVKCGFLVVIAAREFSVGKTSSEIERDLFTALSKLQMISKL